MISKMAEPNTQKDSNMINAVVLLLMASLDMSFFVKPWVKAAKIGSNPMGSIATKIIIKFSMKRFTIVLFYYFLFKLVN